MRKFDLHKMFRGIFNTFIRYTFVAVIVWRINSELKSNISDCKEKNIKWWGDKSNEHRTIRKTKPLLGAGGNNERCFYCVAGNVADFVTLCFSCDIFTTANFSNIWRAFRCQFCILISKIIQTNFISVNSKDNLIWLSVEISKFFVKHVTS